MTFLYIFIAVIVGWVIGFLDSNLRTTKKIRAVENNAEMMIEEAEKKVAQLKSEQANAATPFLPPDDPGLLRLKRQNGRYLLELDGVSVPPELTLDMRKRLIELITVFRLWLDSAQSSSAATPTPPMPDPVRAAVSTPAPVVAPQPVIPIKKPEPEKNIKSLSIVQQIDTVLQEKLLTSPFVKRGIRLQESIQGGVEVYVGLQKFETVDDVPDEEIKAFIRSAIAEWEKKYTPGL
jgi:hypothetical protein